LNDRARAARRGPQENGLESFTFVFFGACALAGSALVALMPKLVHSAFALVLALIGVAGLYWTLGADFLGGVQLLVYVGGITILFIYGVMLTPRDATKWSLGSLLFPGLFALVPLAVLMHLAWRGLEAVIPPQAAASAAVDTRVIGEALMLRDRYLIPFELASLVLLAALVGSVYLARRRQEG
jgi:NADH-quinone oxidoreductase subunit J